MRTYRRARSAALPPGRTEAARLRYGIHALASEEQSYCETEHRDNEQERGYETESVGGVEFGEG